MGHGERLGQRAVPGDRSEGWYLRVGNLSLTHDRMVARSGKTRHSHYLVQWHGVKRDGSRWGRWLLLLPVMAIGAPVSLWAARTPPAMVAQLVVPLPPASPTPPAVQPKLTVHHPISTPPVTEAKQVPVPARVEVAGLEDLPAIGRALRAALRLGEVQDWSSDDGREGLVVVAPQAASLDGRTCRDTTILIRNGGFEGQTRAGRYCIDAADRITMASVSVPGQE